MTFDTKDYYQKIEWREYEKLAGIKGVRFFTNKVGLSVEEKDKIYKTIEENLKLLSHNRRAGIIKIEYKFHTTFHSGSINHDLVMTFLSNWSEYAHYDIYINKVEDEWFLANITYKSERFRHLTYKCDQLEGLLLFIKDQIKKSQSN